MRQAEKVCGFSVIRFFLACDRRFWPAETGVREIVSTPAIARLSLCASSHS